MRGYSPPEVDRILGIRGSYYIVPKAIFHLLKGDSKKILYRAYIIGVKRGLGFV